MAIFDDPVVYMAKCRQLLKFLKMAIFGHFWPFLAKISDFGQKRHFGKDLPKMTGKIIFHDHLEGTPYDIVKWYFFLKKN